MNRQEKIMWKTAPRSIRRQMAEPAKERFEMKKDIPKPYAIEVKPGVWEPYTSI